MEFWGVEVKAGSPLKVNPDIGKVIHISQAALGEGNKEKGSLIPLRVNIDDKKIVLGSLSTEKFPHVSLDLIFEKEFELSHDWKNGSVYFCGYMVTDPTGEEDEEDSDSEDDEEDMPLGNTENGKVEQKAEEVKPAANKGKEMKPESSAKKVTLVEPKKDDSESDDSDDDSEDDKDMLGSDSDDIGGSEDDDDSDEEDDSDDSDEDTPKKPSADKKRPNESASKTPVPAKKSKLDSAQKTDGKKGGHVDTPHPSKKAEKTPAPNKQPPKVDLKIACGSCPKKFSSDSARQSHTKAKHAAK